MSSRSARVLLIGALSLVALAFAFHLWNSDNEGLSTSSPSVPGFILKTQEGKEVHLESFRGKFVVLHFWASWCPPCIEELPAWLQFSQSFQREDIQWIAISLDESWEDANKLLSANDVPKSVISLLDAEKKVAARFGSHQLPETYLLNREHEVATKWVGAPDWGSASFKKDFERLIQ